MLRVDLAVYNQRRELVLTAEVKNMRDVSDKWASQFRRNILAHGNYPLAKYFLLATPDKFFLWTYNSTKASNPDYSIDVKDELGPIFKEFDVDENNLSGYIFEEIVTRWLKNIMYPEYRESARPLPTWIVDSGLEKDILYGDFYFEQAA